MGEPYAADPDDLAATYRAAVAFIRQGKSISATKLLRSSIGLSLPEAKKLVEAIVEEHYLWKSEIK